MTGSDTSRVTQALSHNAGQTWPVNSRKGLPLSAASAAHPHNFRSIEDRSTPGSGYAAGSRAARPQTTRSSSAERHAAVHAAAGLPAAVPFRQRQLDRRIVACARRRVTARTVHARIIQKSSRFSMTLFLPLQKRFKFCLIPRHTGCLIPADQLQHMAVVIRNDLFEIRNAPEGVREWRGLFLSP